jgi:hypothetical protein
MQARESVRVSPLYRVRLGKQVSAAAGENCADKIGDPLGAGEIEILFEPK